MSPSGPLSPTAGQDMPVGNGNQVQVTATKGLPGSSPPSSIASDESSGQGAQAESVEGPAEPTCVRKLVRNRSLLSDTLAGQSSQEMPGQPLPEVQGGEWQTPIRRVKVGANRPATAGVEGEGACTS